MGGVRIWTDLRHKILVKCLIENITSLYKNFVAVVTYNYLNERDKIGIV